MKLSMTTYGLDLRHGEKGAIRLLADAGFTAADLSLIGMMNDDDPYCGPEYLEHAREIREYGDQLGIVYNQTHSLYPVFLPDDEAFNRSRWERLLRSIEITAEVGAKYLVVHPFSTEQGSEFERNVEFFDRLVPYLKGTGVKVAIENTFNYGPALGMRALNVAGGEVYYTDETIPKKSFRRTGSTGRELASLLDRLDPHCFGACLDLAHSIIVHEEPAHAIRELGPRMVCMHAHDNDGYTDLHTTPFARVGCIDWEAVITALREIRYAGDFTLESFMYLLTYPDELHADALRLLARTGMYFVRRLT